MTLDFLVFEIPPEFCIISFAEGLGSLTNSMNSPGPGIHGPSCRISAVGPKVAPTVEKGHIIKHTHTVTFILLIFKSACHPR